MPQQMFGQVRQAEFVQPGFQGFKEQGRFEDWRCVRECGNDAVVVVGDAHREHRRARRIEGQVVAHLLHGTAKSVERHDHTYGTLRGKQAPLPRPSFVGKGGGGGWVG